MIHPSQMNLMSTSATSAQRALERGTDAALIRAARIASAAISTGSGAVSYPVRVRDVQPAPTREDVDVVAQRYRDRSWIVEIGDPTKDDWILSISKPA